MKFKELTESSPDTFKGSLTPDLIKSKVWLCQTLSDLGLDSFSSIYILGSWYGNMSVMLDKCGIKFQKIINVDTDKQVLNFSKKLLSNLNINASHLHKDANKLSYNNIDSNSLVINTSIADISGNSWFTNLPKGTLVALQDRNNVTNQTDDIQSFDSQFPLTKTLFLNHKSLHDPETQYQRFMKIGIV